MQHSRPSMPHSHSRSQGQGDLDIPSTIPSAAQSSPKHPSSPVRFATSKNAFGLATSPASSSLSTAAARDDRALLMVDRSPPSAGSSSKTRLRRPSMLSLAQNASFGSEGIGSEGDDAGTEELIGDPPGEGEEFAVGIAAPPTSAASSLNDRRGVISPRSLTKQFNPFAPNPLRPPPQWGPSGFALRNRQGSASHLTFEGLSTTTPPIPAAETLEDQSGIEADMEDLPQRPLPLRWMPSHLQNSSASARRKGKARAEDDLVGDDTRPTTGIHRPPFTGRPLPASLVATLISESAPGEHEIQSEARLQRLISSHPRALPFTPRASRSSRGRFPETVGDEDDDDDFPNRRAIWAARAWTRRDSSSDSDSDDMGMPMDDTAPEPVNSAFAAGMDMDRINSISEAWPTATATASESGKSTPGMSGTNGHPTPPSNGQAWEAKSRPTRMSFSGMGMGVGMVPSPGTGFGLPNAFGGLGMGPGTPIGSPTIERLELATSPGNLSTLPAAIASPSLMQYRESSGGSASMRPGKRKAQVDDRFDPYKRPRGSSPSFSSGSGPFPMSPSRPTPAIPIPNSPSYGLYSSMLSTSTGAQGQGREQINLRTKPNHHPYTRPMSSRSRAASPALSIGSTSGSLTGAGAGGGNGGGLGRERGSFSLGVPFTTGATAGTSGAAGAAASGHAPPSLGGLGLLSLANRGEEVQMIKEEGEAEEMSREDSGMGSAMDED